MKDDATRRVKRTIRRCVLSTLISVVLIPSNLTYLCDTCHPRMPGLRTYKGLLRPGGGQILPHQDQSSPVSSPPLFSALLRSPPLSSPFHLPFLYDTSTSRLWRLRPLHA